MLKKIINNIIYRNRSSSENYIKYLRSKGCIIGDNTYFYSPKTTTIDVQNACFISIGEKCKITQGVTILAHDFSYSIFRPVYHDIPKKAAITKIGNNVFLGLNSIILMGSEIGDNVIIGAGAVVSGKVPDNEVWGGNPAKFIMTLEDYHNKCISKYEEGARLTVQQYLERKKRYPTIEELQFFSSLFLKKDDDRKSIYKKMSFKGDNKEEVIKDCLLYEPKYKSYEDFIKRMIDNEKK